MFKKIALGVALIFLIAFGGGAYWAYNHGEAFIESYVMAQVQEQGGKTLGVKVSLGGFDLSVKDRTASFTDLEIANPEGFDKPLAFQAKGVSVSLGDIARELIVIKDINISGIKVHYIAQAGGSNLTRIRENLETYQAQQAVTETNETEPFEMPKIIIDKFYFEGAKVSPEMKLIAGQSVDTDINLSEIALNDIGRAQNGVEMSEAAEEILETFNSRVTTAVARAGLFEGLTQMALMGVTGGIPVVGVADEILGLVGLNGDDEGGFFNRRDEEPKKLSDTLNN